MRLCANSEGLGAFSWLSSDVELPEVELSRFVPVSEVADRPEDSDSEDSAILVVHMASRLTRMRKMKMHGMSLIRELFTAGGQPYFR